MTDHADKYQYTDAERRGFFILVVIVLVAGSGVVYELGRVLG